MRTKADVVEVWLKENDPDYSKNKHYFNNRRFRRIYEKEVPVECLDDVKGRLCV